MISGRHKNSILVETLFARIPTYRIGLAGDYVRAKTERYSGRRNGFGKDHPNHCPPRTSRL